MEPIIKVERLGKQYRISESVATYDTVRESLLALLRAPIKRMAYRSTGSQSIVWALKDVSFDVLPGEVIGIIGRNGAGKSTLLKILSRITEPTQGCARIRGRLGSLLEVGTGFHPELTGRENVFLSGAVLGMKRQDTARKFDEIVAFSEIERFIDTPVKRYSTGMYLRLAFSVAAYLDPEILILDEVLAVGDASFQLKCQNKMEQIKKEGRTILFVSHNMQAITRLCKRAIYLSEGEMVEDGPALSVVSTYLGERSKIFSERIWTEISGEVPGSESARLRAVRVRNSQGRIADTVDIRELVEVEMEFDVLEPGHVLVPNFQFFNDEDLCIFTASDHDPAWRRRPRPTGRYRSAARIPGNFLSEGTLIVGVSLVTMKPVAVHFHEEEAVAFQVIDGAEGDSARGDYAGPMPGLVRPLLSWSTKFQPLHPTSKSTDS